jgi:hypothetical protein
MIWMSIPGWPGYKASPEGEILSLKKEEPKVLKQWLNPRGYLEVCLSNQGRTKAIAVHKLILLTFKGPPPSGQECCHNDSNRLNNHLGNLRYGTHQENVQDAVRRGTHAQYEALRDACDQGHLFTPENTMRRKTPNGDVRKCKECHRLSIARYRARKKAGLV